MKTAIVFLGLNSENGYSDSLFLRHNVDVALKISVFDLDKLRYAARVAFDTCDGVIFVYRSPSWPDLQKVMLLEFERSSVFVETERPYVVAKGFKEIGPGVFFDLVYGKPVAFLPWDIKENIDLGGVLNNFSAHRSIVRVFEGRSQKDQQLIYEDEVESIYVVDLKDIDEYSKLKGCYTTCGEQPQEALFKVLKQKGKVKIATAESCTAGLVAARIADVPGVSEFLEGGIVSYSNKLKTNILKVSPNTLRLVGAVSEETAKSMAIGAINETNADFSVSVTGIAGPTGATETKPVGLVYFGIASKRQVWVRKKVFSGNRRIVRDKSARYAILLLREFILAS